MAATQARNTSQFAGDYLSIPVKASTKIYAGTLVAIDATGYAIPAKKAVDLTIAGRAEDTVDNSAGAGGDQVILVARGVFKWDNDPATATAIGAVHLLKTCYVVDDMTVTASNTGSSAAGKVIGIDPDGGILVETK